MIKSDGMGGHHSPRSETCIWLTPFDIVDTLGPFDLDPCAAPEPRPWDTAARHITLPEDGLRTTWAGRVWLNPPYGSPTVIGPWMKRMAEHNDGIALIFARTETNVFHKYVWGAASALFFFNGRLCFCYPDGRIADNNAGAPSVLVAYGRSMKDRLRNWNHRPGRYVDL